MQRNKIFFSLFLFITAAMVISCSGVSGGSSSGSSSVPTIATADITQSYQAAGSFWSVVFSTTNFRIDRYDNYGDATATVSVYGTYTTNATTNIMTLTVTNATGNNAPAAGAKAYGLEIPGTVFFLKPADNDSEIIPMIKAGTCPTATKTYNWIIGKFASNLVTPATQEAYGQASFSNNGSGTITAANITNKKTLDGSAGGADGTGPTGACSNGHLSGGGVDMYLTSAGGAMVKTPGSEFIFASPKHTGDVAAADLAGTYTVLVFSESNTAHKNFPAKMIMAANGTGTGDRMTDPDADTTEGSPVSFSGFAAQAGSNGIFKLDMAGGGRLNCNYYETGGKKVVACNGYDSSSKTFFLLGRQR